MTKALAGVLTSYPDSITVDGKNKSNMTEYKRMYIDYYFPLSMQKASLTGLVPREATQQVYTWMCGLKFAKCTHNSRELKCQS